MFFFFGDMLSCSLRHSRAKGAVECIKTTKRYRLQYDAMQLGCMSLMVEFYSVVEDLVTK